MVNIQIPASFQHDIFYTVTQIEVDEKTDRKTAALSYPFWYEIAYENGIAGTPPWQENINQHIKAFMQWWEEHLPFLDECWDERDKEKAAPYMRLGLAHWLCTLFWMNERPVPSAEPEELIAESRKLAHKPINVEERLSFLLEYPNYFHSYLQLKELYTEVKKKEALAKRSRNHE